MLRGTKNTIFTAMVLFALSVVLWVVFMWPLPRFFSSGIAYGQYTHSLPPRYIVQGDHLQLLYHFNLLGDYINGVAPWFRDIWEFNTSDADVPRVPSLCYAPFALPFLLFKSVLFSEAASWNAAQVLSVFLGVLFCYLLARRYGADRGLAVAVALLSSAVPYRWETLSGGSPTGFGMGLVPVVAYGVDLAVNERRIRGGVLAGVALILCYGADLHCFLFATLAVPVWGIVALLRCGAWRICSRKEFLALLKACIPVVIAAMISMLIAKALKSGYESTDVAQGRGLISIRHYSPDWRAFFNPRFYCNVAAQFYMGSALCAALMVSGVVALLGNVLQIRRCSRRSVAKYMPLVAMSCVALAILFSFLLALGTNGPCEALPLRLIRKLVPPFKMVRQPIKVFCLLPALYTALLSMAIVAVNRAEQRTLARFYRIFLYLVLPVAVFTIARQMWTGVCLLPSANLAYVEAAKSETADNTPRALVIPIWPGDSSYSSVYQYNAQHASLRMLGGYSAVKTAGYVTNVYDRFRSMNEGIINEEQLQVLRDMNVSHIIFHENLYPAQVSYYPVGITLAGYLACPGLELVKHANDAWVFRLRDSSAGSSSLMQPETLFHAPARYWSFNAPYAEAQTQTWMLFRTATDGSSGWWRIRARTSDNESTNAVFMLSDGSGQPVPCEVPMQKGRHWQSVLVGACGNIDSPGKSYIRAAPGTEVSHITFETFTNELGKIAFDKGFAVPAWLLSHEFGRTRFDGTITNAVLEFDPVVDPPCRAVSGPNIPLPKGRYMVELRTNPENADCFILRNREFVSDGATPAHIAVEYTATQRAELIEICIVAL